MEPWELLVVDGETAATQMSIDERLAHAAHPTLRLFRWPTPAVSYGFRQQPPCWISRETLSAYGIDLVERPTGGGVAVHGSDLSCSVTMPATRSRSLHEAMRLVCQSLADAVSSFGVLVLWHGELERSRHIVYCLTEPSPYALTVRERKLCGLAARRYPVAWLIQASLLVSDLPRCFERVMPREVCEAFQTRAVSLEAAAQGRVAEDELIARIVQAWERRVGHLVSPGSATPWPLSPLAAVDAM